jgi:hypothetical protein
MCRNLTRIAMPLLAVLEPDSCQFLRPHHVLLQLSVQEHESTILPSCYYECRQLVLSVLKHERTMLL